MNVLLKFLTLRIHWFFVHTMHTIFLPFSVLISKGMLFKSLLFALFVMFIKYRKSSK